MYPSCNAVYFECGGGGKQNDVGSLPAGVRGSWSADAGPRRCPRSGRNGEW
ncbi:hypothetical protein I79_024834 [Cricetulus griseus]|uniref:Uncharacterized protein n=1 Tax=Cricetulus griseus TaxID=10029 RepID=G3ILR3_CRIGR|nr:hypothetical protein I79_024834 [Cricetulus griseus]